MAVVISSKVSSSKFAVDHTSIWHVKSDNEVEQFGKNIEMYFNGSLVCHYCIYNKEHKFGFVLDICSYSLSTCYS